MASHSNKLKIIFILSALAALSSSFVKVYAVDPKNDDEKSPVDDANRSSRGTNLVINDPNPRDGNSDDQNSSSDDSNNSVEDRSRRDGSSSSKSIIGRFKDEGSHAFNLSPSESVVRKFELPDARSDCAICLDTIPLDKLITTECSHKFHEGCLQNWMNARILSSELCPVCRTRLPEFQATSVVENHPSVSMNAAEQNVDLFTQSDSELRRLRELVINQLRQSSIQNPWETELNRGSNVLRGLSPRTVQPRNLGSPSSYAQAPGESSSRLPSEEFDTSRRTFPDDIPSERYEDPSGRGGEEGRQPSAWSSWGNDERQRLRWLLGYNPPSIAEDEDVEIINIRENPERLLRFFPPIIDENRPIAASSPSNLSSERGASSAQSARAESSTQVDDREQLTGTLNYDSEDDSFYIDTRQRPTWMLGMNPWRMVEPPTVGASSSPSQEPATGASASRPTRAESDTQTDERERLSETTRDPPN